MIAVIQRVQKASIEIEKQTHSSINNGLLILLGITHDDTHEDINWLSAKICNLRIFADEAGKMNHSILDTEGEILVVSQFTLFASTQKGNRPSFLEAAKPEQAIPLYEAFIQACSSTMGKEVATGVFGADMKVELINDGPVTIIIDTKNKQ